MSETSKAEDTAVLEDTIKALPEKPGVYRYYDNNKKLIYVGKAGNLKKRVSSYFNKHSSNTKTLALVENIASIEFTITRNDTEALLLENNLIKHHRPRYNVLLRDDKSYPYIFLSSQQEFPRLEFHRGAKLEKGRYFGPYPSALSARNTLSLLQKVFPVRQCSDNEFNNRSRPCLQYQIKRCTAPCVGYIEHNKYMADVADAVLFLEGKENAAIDQLVERMEHASTQQDFEAAAVFRDQITHLRRSLDNQFETAERENMDIIACLKKDEAACIEVFYLRNGRNLGNKTYYPKNVAGSSVEEILYAFLSQHYLVSEHENIREKMIPSQIIINKKIDDEALLAQSLTTATGSRVCISSPVKGEKKKWIELAESNAKTALDIHISNKTNIYKRFVDLQQTLELESLPQRIECFDISHTQGEATVASCVVFDTNGSINSDYRRFNIEGIQAGDDYAAMKQALQRRYARIKSGEINMPDILLIDGGKGQVSQATAVMQELNIADVNIIGVAKGRERKPGLETLIFPGKDSGQFSSTQLSSDSPALHLIQSIRDEAHRFAITGHRQRRAKSRSRSVLEDVKGLGSKRRQQLLKQFGGIQEVTRASVDEIARIKGISQELAQRIYNALH